MGDRSGGRESKGSSLKQSKKNPGSVAAKVKKEKSEYVLGSRPKSKAIVPEDLVNGLYFDCGLAILSRQFDRDRDRSLLRAKAEKVFGILCWFSDIEKLKELSDFCKNNPSFCYFLSGIHPDNIDRMNKKLQDTWILSVDEHARSEDCIGMLSGLNLSRDIGSHFAQEKMLRSIYSISESLSLPLFLHIHDARSLDRAVEVLQEEGWDGLGGKSIPIVVHDVIPLCQQDATFIQRIVDNAMYASVSFNSMLLDHVSNLLPPPPDRSCSAPPAVFSEVLYGVLDQLPISRLLVCSNGPWNTPQNLPDLHTRTLRNESSNLPFVYDALVEHQKHKSNGAWTLTGAGLALKVKENSIRIFHFVENAVEEKVPSSSSSTAPVPAESVVDGTSTAPGPAVSLVGSVKPGLDGGHYACIRCRSRLFNATDILQQLPQIQKNAFVSFNLDAKLLNSNQMFADRNTLCCKNCGVKIGKCLTSSEVLAETVETPSEVGAADEGKGLFQLRVTSRKVDFVDETATTSALADRALRELEEGFARGSGAGGGRDTEKLEAELEQMRLEKKERRKASKKKKDKSDNKGNYSYFRNKTFIPNASRTSKAAGDSKGDVAKRAAPDRQAVSTDEDEQSSASNAVSAEHEKDEGDDCQSEEESSGEVEP